METREELLARTTTTTKLAQEARSHTNWARVGRHLSPDATYIEHHYGTMPGREAIYEWDQKTWPSLRIGDEEFPHDWWQSATRNGLVESARSRTVSVIPADG